MSKELNKLVANALSKHSSSRVELATKSKPFIGKVGDMHYFINVDGVDNNFASKPFGRQIDSLKKIEAFKKSAKSAYISIKRTPIAKAFKQFKDLYKPIEFFGATKINDSFKDDSFKIWYTTAEEVASTETAALNKPKPKGLGRLGNVKKSVKFTKEQLESKIAKDSKLAEYKITKLVDELTSCINLARNTTNASYSKLEKKLENIIENLTRPIKSKSPRININNVIENLDAIKKIK